MRIQITSGTGRGPTSLAAFDNALFDAGVANYNLIVLSSVIPLGSRVAEVDRVEQIGGSWGDRLYVVMAEERVETPNVEAWAGVGWVHEPETGNGLFVEHHGHSEATVRSEITESLHGLCATRGINLGPVRMRVNGVMCRHEPVCALVVAVYQPESW